MEVKTFGAACLQYFGKKEGQSSGDFLQELKQLTEKDRADLREYFKAIGWDVQ